jgi:enoyl-CoA hydratase/carnithine racemase
MFKVGDQTMTIHIQSIQHGAVLEARLNRPEKKNALTGAMYDGISELLQQACSSNSIRAVLLTAEGPTFTAGNDLAEFLSISGNFADSPQGRFVRAITGATKPIVAAVPGRAVGIGTTMLLHCDLVYGNPDLKLSTPFVEMGLVPEAGSSLLYPTYIGLQRASALLLLGETLDAEAAVAAGLVNAIVPADELHAYALEKAQALASKAPEAFAVARRLMRANRTVLEAQMAAEGQAFARAVRGPEAREAFTAFFEKRKAAF